MAFLVGYAVQKRSLTTWILVSMILGAEFGYDFSSVAVNLNVVSQIFLRLIKTIIAPLLFAWYRIASGLIILLFAFTGWKLW